MTKLILNIEPKPQTRPKFSKWGTYEDPKMKAWRRHCALLIKNNYKGPYHTEATQVNVTFYMQAPKTISKKPSPKAKESTWAKFKRFIAEVIWHITKPDLDNLVKALFDSVSDSKVVWSDDNIVCDLHARKVYSPNPRIEMEIENLEYDELGFS